MLREETLHQDLESQHGPGAAVPELPQLISRQNLFGWRVAGIEEQGLEVRGPEELAGKLGGVPPGTDGEHGFLVGLAVEEAGESTDQTPVEGGRGDVLARHSGVGRLGEGSPPACDVVESLR